MSDDSAWREVDLYAQKRREDAGDVFGWLRSEDDGEVAVILAAMSSDDDSFPQEISGIRVVVKKMRAPEKQA
jgi:hypothetical protein